MSKLFIIYKTTNLLNGKYYIGKHTTDVLEDGYLGSGVYLARAINKYGKDNFTRDILFIYDNEIEMTLKEKELVTEELINSGQVYNIALGGQGGNLGPIVNQKISVNTSKALTGKNKTEQHKKALSQSKLSKNIKQSDDTKNKISLAVKHAWNTMSDEERRHKCGFPGQFNPFYGKTHSEDSISKMRATIGDSRKGEKNPRAKPITVNGVTYSTRKECMTALGMNKPQFYKFLGENDGNTR
jgi:group I intron endonuclease